MPSGPPPAPIIQRLTIRYAKRGRMRFASHRDVARAIERGVRKAGVPVAYSAGFSPHPRISYSGGAPTGAASEAEYLEISLTRRCEPADLGRSLDAALPDGIDVIDVVEAESKSAGLQFEAAQWEVLLPGVTAATARLAAQAFLAAPCAVVERLTSKGKRQLDARAAVISLDVAGEAGDSPGDHGTDGGRHVGSDPAGACAIIRMVVQQMTPAVRPDDILTALGQFTPLASAAPPVVTRLWQGPLDSEVVATSKVVAEIATATAVTDSAVAHSTALATTADGASHHGAERSAPGSTGPHSASAQGLVTNKATRLSVLENTGSA
ncbi:MAG TPA: TIGR03936 family radical SAM-associated protein, partial [Streptosporangiaceae bacterium]|nr:TIGR03936 family radical SAM-associated protein [Streptosporangiaceae bacterium]